MRDLRRIVWHRGMFLTPQHFQTADNRVDETIQFRFSSSLFANWGVTDLRIIEESLANGLFSTSARRDVAHSGWSSGAIGRQRLHGR